MQIKITVSVGLEHLWRDASWPTLSPRLSSVITPSAFRVRAQRSGNKRGPVCVYVTSTKSKWAGGAFEVDGVVFITDWWELHHRRSETHALNHLFTRLIKLGFTVNAWALTVILVVSPQPADAGTATISYESFLFGVWWKLQREDWDVTEVGIVSSPTKCIMGPLFVQIQVEKKQIQRLKMLLGHQNGELLWHSRVLQSGGRLLLWSWSRRCTAWRHRRDFATLQMWQLYVGCSYMVVWLESNKSFILSCFKTSAVPTSCCRCTSVTHLQ